jgi:hypothetical protein
MAKRSRKKVNVTKQEDSWSDSSWFVRDAGESFEEDAEWVTGDGIEDEDINETEAGNDASEDTEEEKEMMKQDKAPKNWEDSITYFNRQSSTKTEAVAR